MVSGEGKMLFPFTPRHLRPFFRHRGEGSEGKKHDLTMYARVREKNNECAKKRSERNGDHRQKKFGRGLFHHQKNCSTIKNRKIPSSFVFFSYAVLPISEIVFSTSEVDFSVSELFSAVVVGGHISATLSVSDIHPLQRRSLRRRAVRRFVVALVYG